MEDKAIGSKMYNHFNFAFTFRITNQPLPKLYCVLAISIAKYIIHALTCTDFHALKCFIHSLANEQN